MDFKLPISPNKNEIFKYFPDFELLDKETLQKINHWDEISPEEHDYLEEIIKTYSIQVKLDNLGFIYNYFKFIHRVSKTNYNEKVRIQLKELREIYPIYKLIENRGEFAEIVFKPKGSNKDIKINSQNILQEIDSLFQIAQSNVEYWKVLHTLFADFKEHNALHILEKPRTGNLLDVSLRTLNVSIKMFKKFLDEYCTSNRSMALSNYVTIGNIITKIDLAEDSYGFRENYNTYYKDRAYDLDIDVVLKKTKYALDEVIPPYFFISENKHCIIE